MLEIYVQTLFGTVNISFNKLVRHLNENVKVITANENIPSGTHVMVVKYKFIIWMISICTQ